MRPVPLHDVQTSTPSRKLTGRRSQSGREPGPFLPNSGRKMFAHDADERGAAVGVLRTALGECWMGSADFSATMHTPGRRLCTRRPAASGAAGANAGCRFMAERGAGLLRFAARRRQRLVRRPRRRRLQSVSTPFRRLNRFGNARQIGEPV